MRLVSWNIAWMNNWFVGNDQVAFRDAYHPRGNPQDAIADVDALASRVAQVILELAPDVLAIQEGPSDPREMKLFIDKYLRDDQGEALFNSFIGADGGAQKVYFLVHKEGSVQDAHLAIDEATRGLEQAWEADVAGVGDLADYDFTRRPLVIDASWNGKTLRLVNLHLKSKYIHNGKSLWDDPDKRPQFIQGALLQRRRISAESMRVRRYLSTLLDEDPLRMVIVVGDMNDGPGADYFEDRYLTHNLTDLIVGSTYHPAKQFQHAFLHAMPAAARYTAKFDDFVTGEKDKSLVLDHILVSPVLRSGGLVSEGLLYASIAHDAFERAIDDGAGSSRAKFPSDHRPALAVFGP